MFRTNAVTTVLLAAVALLAAPSLAVATTVKTYVYGGGQVLVSKHSNYEMVYTCDSGNAVANGAVGATCEADGFLFSNRVNITARANAGYRFVGYLAPGNTCVGASDMCQATAWGAGTMTVHAFFVDDTPPDTAIINRPLPRTSSRSADFALTSPQAAARFECKLDTEEFHACEASVPMRNLSEGLHTLAARAIDPAGNVDATPASYTWEVDTTGPTITAGSVAAFLRTGVSIPMMVEAGGHFQCTIQAPGQSAGSAFSCASPFVLDAPGDGEWVVRARGVDDLGNSGPWLVRSWIRDTASPTVFVLTGAAEGSIVASRSPQFAFDANDANPVSFTCATNGAVAAACSSPLSLSQLPDGAHTLTIRAHDGAGNTGTLVRRFTVDGTAPLVVLDGGPADGSSTTERTARFTVASDDVEAMLRCEHNALVLDACAGELILNDLAVGAHRLRVVARDAAGNESAVVRTWTVRDATTIDPVDPITPRDPVQTNTQPTPNLPAPSAPAGRVPAPVLTVSIAKSIRLTPRSTKLPIALRCSTACTVAITGRATLGRLSAAVMLKPTAIGTARRAMQLQLPVRLRTALRTATTGAVKLTIVVTDAAGNRATRLVRAKLVR